MSEEFEKWLRGFSPEYLNTHHADDMYAAFKAGQKCPTKEVQDVIDQAIEEVRHAREVLASNEWPKQYATRISINLGQYTDKLEVSDEYRGSHKTIQT